MQEQRLIDANEVLGQLYCKLAGTIAIPQRSMLFGIIKKIEDAPTISPRDWTPCAEGMPDTNDDVYITYEYRGKRIAAVGFMGHSGAWYILSNDDGNEARVNAVAWQPLPSPYRAEDTTGKVKDDEFMREAMYDQLHSNGN